MDDRELSRIRFITRHFDDLQGLRSWVPLGILALGWTGPPVLRAASVAAAILLIAGARRYYRRSFGEVEPVQDRPAAAELAPVSIFSPAGTAFRTKPLTPGRQRFLIVLGLIPAVLLGFQFVFSQPWITTASGVVFEPSPGLPWSSPAFGSIAGPLPYFLCATLLIAIWLHRGCRMSQGYLPALGALLLGLPLLAAAPAPSSLDAALLLCGAAMVCAGLLDHWQLVRALGASDQGGDR
jgi:hypothetical protein